jgi:uncharacterized protein YfiM (DUF2279 family)
LTRRSVYNPRAAILAAGLFAAAVACVSAAPARTGTPKPADRWFAADKARHFTVSFLSTGAISYTANHRWHLPPGQRLAWSAGVTVSLGIAKEIRDLRRPDRGMASLKDLGADLAGAAAAAVLVSRW